MKAVIMAGGQGTRLRPVEDRCPKPMVRLAGRPLMEHILLLLRRHGITRVCATLHYMPQAVTEYFGDGSRLGMDIRYRLEETPLGTAGGVKAAEDFWQGEDFLVVSGDAACDFDLSALIRAHEAHRPAVTMALYPRDEPLDYGTVVTDRQGRVVSFVEKPVWPRVVTDLVNTGIYVISPAAMAPVPPGVSFDFARDLFPRLMARGMEIRGLPMDGYWCDIGTPRAYYTCCLDALDGRLRLEQPPEIPAPPIEMPRREPLAVCRTLPCARRARLMRALTESLMEAGADLSDGLCLSDGGRQVRIAPDGGSGALRIEAQDPETAEKYLKMARSAMLSCENIQK